MKSDKLYRVQREDLPKLEQLLYRCFAHDPLYETLIQGEWTLDEVHTVFVPYLKLVRVLQDELDALPLAGWMNFMRHVRFLRTAKN